MKISLLGAGNRGIGYLRWIKFFFKKAEIESICDINIEKCNYASNKYKAKNRFYNPADFFKKPGEDGAIIIATQDKDHVKHALKAIDAGYKEILLEKPVSSDYKEIEGLLSYAKERYANIVVCHVLRYTKYYEKLKEIVDSGKIGKVLTINHKENVGYFHYAHSYVRGNWSRGDLTSPFILAKCSHDFDLFHYILSDDCVSLSSYGDLSYFKKENAPKDSAERCMDCKIDCPYNAFNLYIKDPILKSTFLKFMGPTITGLPKPNKEDKINALKTGPYGRCVYKCDNNVC
ncbi:MAG: Gfo/Idh/MocA family oxidoreductase, partial [Bacillales bacterium]|nr:Gfo/Idh/MocA family oxidoreductase [Bacillales bacterium]